MKYRVIFVVIIIFALVMLNSVFAAVKNIKIGEGVMQRALFEETQIKVSITSEKEKYDIKEFPNINIKIENISGAEIEIYLSNINIFLKKANKEISPSYSIEGRLGGKINLPEGAYVSVDIPLCNIYKTDNPGEYILEAFYKVPQKDSFLKSNSLKITIEP